MAAVWAGMIFTLSGIPSLSSGLDADFILRKCAHALEYFVLYVLLLRAWTQSKLPSGGFWPLILCALYAMSDEFHQSFVSGRFCSGIDVLIDFCGAACAAVILKIRKEKQQS